MSNSVNIGFLNFGIDGQDTPLRNKLDSLKTESIELDKILSNLNIGGSLNPQSFDKVLKKQADAAESSSKSISKSLESVGKVDFTANIDQMLAKLREVKNDMGALQELMSETQNTSKKLEIKKEYEQASDEAEKLMRQISALDEAQTRLNSNRNNNLTPSSTMSDDRTLRQMADYYKELEKTSLAHAKAQEKAALEAEKLTRLREKAVRQASEQETRENARQIAEQEKKANQAERIARQTGEAQRKAADRIRLEQERVSASIGMTNKTMFDQKQLLSQLSNTLGTYFSIYQAGSFVRELAMVSGEFEKQRLSLAAILQNGDAANRIFNQIKDLAVYSPFNFKELTDYAKQLSAFSVPSTELFETMKRLADISAGVGVDMGRIILAYGQVRSAAVLRGQELRQFTEAGIPLVDELAKKFSILEGRVVSAGEVFDKISDRQVPFAMIKEIFEDLTSEGGKFFNMQEIQATSLAGMISNLRDAYDIMLDSIGKANQGVLKGAVGGLVDVMDNWENFANILMGILAAYGLYKAGIIVLNALHGTENRMLLQSVMVNKAKEATLLRQASLYRTLTAAEQIKIATSTKLTTAEIRQLAVSGQLTKENALRLIATRQITVAQAGHLKTTLAITRAEIAQAAATSMLGRSMLVFGASVRAASAALMSLAMNPYTWILLAIGGIVYALGEWSDKQKEVDETAKAVAQSVQESYKKISKALEKLNPKIEVALSVKGSDADILAAIQEINQVLENNVPEDVFGIIMAGADKIPAATDKLKYLKSALDDVYKGSEQVKNSLNVLIENAFSAADGFLDDGLITNIKDYNKTLATYKKIENLYQNGNKTKEDLGWVEAARKQMELEKTAFDEDYRTFVNYIKKSQFPDVTDWSKNPNLNYGSQAIVVRLRDELLSRIENLSPDIEKEITDLFNKEFFINPQIVVQKQVATSLQDAIENTYKSLPAPDKQTALTTVMSNADENMLSWIERVQGTYAKAKQERDQYNKSLAKSVQLLPDIKYQDQVMKTVEGLSKAMGFDLEKNKKKTKKEEDPEIEKLKKYTELLKKAKSAHDDLLKVMNKEDAANAFSTIPTYNGVDLKDLTKSGYDAAIDSIIASLENKGKKLSTSGKNLLQSLILDKGDRGLKEIIDKSKQEISRIEKELSVYHEKYNLYEQIFKVTGDKGQAAKFVFGDPESEVKTYIEELKSAFEKFGGISYPDFLKLDDSKQSGLLQNDQIKKLHKDIEQAEKVESKRKNDIYLSSLKDFLSYQEKRLAITTEYEEKIAIARQNNNHKLADKLATALKSELLKLTPEYDKFFTSIYSLTQTEAIKIGNLIKQNLKDQLDKGVISTKEYYEGIKNINKELEKSQRGISLFQTIQNEGIDGFLKAMREKADSDYQSASIDYTKALDDYNAAMKIGNGEAADMAQSNMASAEGAMGAAQGMQSFAGAASGAVSMVDMIVKAIDQSIRAMQQLVDQFAELAESRGIDTDDGKWADIKGAMSVLSAVNEKAKGAWDSAKSGDGIGAAVNTIGIITSGLTAINKWHDSKLDKTIKKSQFEVKKLGYAYQELARIVDRQLGATSSKQAGEMIENQKKQISELEKQRRAEIDKKKTNWETVADMEAQISQAKDALRYFYEDLADEEFGINIKDWASKISDALVDAFANGEDAAAAFDKTVADLMKNVINNMIKLNILEPAMDNIRKYLFGGDGFDGVFSDGHLSEKDLSGLGRYFRDLKDKVKDAQGLWDRLNEAWQKEFGESLNGVMEKDTLSKGIQALTEDTGHLLGSYINAIRGNTSKQLLLVERLVANSDQNNSTFALQLATLKQIEANTGRNADSAESILEILKRLTLNGSGIKLNI